MSRVKNHEAAHDLLQDLYLKLYAQRKRIEPDTARFYFFRSARNHCLDWHRKQIPDTGDTAWNELETGEESTYEKTELTQHFRALIEQLPPNQQEVIYLKDVCELSTRETMEITGLTENNMRVNLSRARAKVKEGLAKIYHYEATTKY